MNRCGTSFLALVESDLFMGYDLDLGDLQLNCSKCSQDILVFVNFCASHKFRLDDMGALQRKYLAERLTWRLLTFPCLHAGFIHLCVNLVSVLLVGIHLEQEFGSRENPVLFILFHNLEYYTSSTMSTTEPSLYFPFYLAVRIGMIYILSAFLGSLFAALFVRGNPQVGASGALFGLLGTTLSRLIRNWSTYTDKVIQFGYFFSPQ